MEGGFGEYIALKRRKLNDQVAHIRNVGIFDGMKFWVNGYTQPSQLELRDMIVQNGGHFAFHQTSDITHIVTTNLPDSKVKALKNEIVVLPDWIVKSCEAQNLIPIEPFLLYTKNRADLRSFLQQEDTLNTNSEEFISDFYKSSRLHHLSTWKYELMDYAQELLQKYPNKKCSANPNVIMHVDMDCFFASVSLLSRPDLQDKPVGVSHIVTGKSSASSMKDSTSSVASCNYSARSFGIRNGMSIKSALLKCPDLILLPYDFNSYNIVSKKLYRILVEHCDNIQPISCDEAFIDVSSQFQLSLSAENVKTYAMKIKKEIFDATGCNASIGISKNILLARLATKKAKPNGIFYLQEESVLEYLDSVMIADLPGVGYSIASKLEKDGIINCAHLRSISLSKLQSDFGPKTGKRLYDQCRGIDAKQLDSIKERKSIGAEVNWGVRFSSSTDAEKFLLNLAKEVSNRMKKLPVFGKKLQLKLMVRQPDAGAPLKFLGHGICDTISRSKKIGATNTFETIKSEAWSILEGLNVPFEDIRGIGIHMSDFIEKLEQKENQNLLGMLKEMKEKKLGEKGFDPNVFDELPKDVQDQILHETREEGSNMPSLSQLDSEVLDSIPIEMKNEILQSIHRSSPKVLPSPKRMLNSPKHKKVNRTLTQAWGILPHMQSHDVDQGVFNELPLDIRLDIIKEKKMEQRLVHVDEPLETFESEEELKIKKIKATFNGQMMKMKDIKALIAREIDLDYISEDIKSHVDDYLLQLFNICNIAKLRKFLLFLLEKSKSSACWYEEVQMIIIKYQDLTFQKYGNYLDLS